MFRSGVSLQHHHRLRLPIATAAVGSQSGGANLAVGAPILRVPRANLECPDGGCPILERHCGGGCPNLVPPAAVGVPIWWVSHRLRLRLRLSGGCPIDSDSAAVGVPILGVRLCGGGCPNPGTHSRASSARSRGLSAEAQTREARDSSSSRMPNGNAVARRSG